MYVSDRLTGPRVIADWTKTALEHYDSAGHDGMLENLAYSFSRLIARCMLEMGQADDAGPGSLEGQAGPIIRSGLRWVLRTLASGPETPGGPQAPGTGFRSTPRDPAAGSPRELAVPRSRNPARVIFCEALDPIERDAFRAVAVSRAFAA